MQVVLLRVGIDTGAGGINGPIFDDGTFELIPIPDGWNVDDRTYGNTIGRYGRPLIDYFPQSLRNVRASQSMHVDPEFNTFTYGDPTSPKRGLRRLQAGDLLAFYAGLQHWPSADGSPALYLIGYFEVACAGVASDFRDPELFTTFGGNAHVRHPNVLADQRDRLVLVKGGSGSRLLTTGVQISEIATDRSGRPLKVLSQSMREIFGDFGGRVSIQRSPPRWVDQTHTEMAASFVRDLR